MQRYESFGECLKRCLKEADLSASEAARLVGFRSRNSIFRILAGDAGDEVKLRFLESLYEAIGSAWPDERWMALQEALSVERLGVERYRANQAFERVLRGVEEPLPECVVHQHQPDGSTVDVPLTALLDEAANAHRAEIIITGCCESGLSRLIAERCGAAGAAGRLTVRHYIDTAEDRVTQNILGVLPLVSRPWYNARLVETDSGTVEALALYKLHAIHLQMWDAEDHPHWVMCVRYDGGNFLSHGRQQGMCPSVAVLDRWRFHLELLKPIARPGEGPETFVQYTEQYGQLEEGCTILSMKPDVHFNCIPADVLESAILQAFDQAGMAAGPELVALVAALKKVHNARFDNMMHKRRPSHLVYSLQEMERFMRTGVLTDQFFIQRAYTVEERRTIIRVLLDAMRDHPYFNVHFLKMEAPELRYEISYYDGRGVMLMDAYTGYDLDRDHSEALITLPAFMESFRCYFMEELLPHYVLSRAETIRTLEALLVMDIQE